MENKTVIESVKTWVETLVVGLNLCPFAKGVLVANEVRFSVTEATTEEQLLAALQAEIELLDRNSSIETSLLIHPAVLQDFYDYNQFLEYADGLLIEMEREGVYQIASFHPDYQFGGTEHDDAENFTNRSPYPMLHLIREASLEQAVADYPDADKIPERNIALAQRLGRDKLQAMLQACYCDSVNQ